jgi:hypothetical protein
MVLYQSTWDKIPWLAGRATGESAYKNRWTRSGDVIRIRPTGSPYSPRTELDS